MRDYKKRNQRGPWLIYGAVALVILGVILLVVWLASPGKPLGQMFATDTPTVTATYTPTSTSTPTMTATITETPTVTVTPTPSEDFPYTILECDSLEGIAQKFNLGPDGSLLIYYKNQTEMENNNGVIFVGQTITIPKPGSVLPTSSPIRADIPSGRLIEYRVLPGDTLAGIAFKFNSIDDNIVEENDIENANGVISRVSALPVADKGVLKTGEAYTAALRLSLDRAQLPKPLQVTATGRKEWTIGSEWHRWPYTAPEREVK